MRDDAGVVIVLSRAHENNLHTQVRKKLDRALDVYLAAFFKVADSYDRVLKKSRKRGGRTGVLRARHRVSGDEILPDALRHGFDYFLLRATKIDDSRVFADAFKFFDDFDDAFDRDG